MKRVSSSWFRDFVAKSVAVYPYAAPSILAAVPRRRRDATTKIILIPLLRDNVHDGDKFFNLRLMNSSIVGAIGNRGTAVFNVTDDDSYGQFAFSQPFFSCTTLSLMPFFTSATTGYCKPGPRRTWVSTVVSYNNGGVEYRSCTCRSCSRFCSVVAPVRLS